MTHLQNRPFFRKKMMKTRFGAGSIYKKGNFVSRGFSQKNLDIV
jgi:hypothetical protein